jgi:hypothetical protein
MREFVKISPKFWIGPTGRAIRKSGVDAQLVALYLLSSPHVSFIGMYHLPMVYIAADTGLSIDAVRAALTAIERTGFARYDEDSECLWVIESAKWQVGERMDVKDAKTKYVQKEFDALPSDCPFKAEFMAKYGRAYHMRGTTPLDASAEAAKESIKSSKAKASKSTAQDGKGPVKFEPSKKDIDLFRQYLAGFQARRKEAGLSTPATDKRIAASALKLAEQVGYVSACNALFDASEATDFECADLAMHLSPADRDIYDRVTAAGDV